MKVGLTAVVKAVLGFLRLAIMLGMFGYIVYSEQLVDTGVATAIDFYCIIGLLLQSNIIKFVLKENWLKRVSRRIQN